MIEPSISVVICAYTEDRWTDLQAAVASVAEQTLTPLETIVVVDHNPSLLAEVRSRLDVVSLSNDDRQGLAGARNTGLRAARGTVVAFLDDDAFAAPEWLASLAVHYRRPEVIGVGGAVRPLWSVAPPAWWPAEYNWVVGCSYQGMPRSTARVRNFIGANMSFRRRLFDDIGGFRLGIGRVGTRPFGCEETELCIRATQRFPDAELLYDPQALVHHRVGAERAKWRYFVSRCYAEGKSKAVVSRFVGAGDGLRSERQHALRVLPVAAVRALFSGLAHRRRSDMARAGVIASGLALSTFGYSAGRLKGQTSPHSEPAPDVRSVSTEMSLS